VEPHLEPFERTTQRTMSRVIAGPYRNGPACRTLCEETLRAASQFGQRPRHINWRSTRGFAGTLNVRGPGCCNSASLLNAKRMPGPASREVVIYIFLLDEHLDNSCRSVACLNVARLEQSQDCRRRDIWLLRAYALNSARADHETRTPIWTGFAPVVMAVRFAPSVEGQQLLKGPGQTLRTGNNPSFGYGSIVATHPRAPEPESRLVKLRASFIPSSS
jgi:hypothetical protein